MPFFPVMHLRIDLRLDNGKVRFVDIGTPEMNFASERVIGPNSEKARRLGLTTMGEVYRAAFDLRPCGT